MLSNEEVVDFVRDNLQRYNLGYNIIYQEQKFVCNVENFVLCFIKVVFGGEDYVFVSISLSIFYFDVCMYCDDIIVIIVYFDWSNVVVEQVNVRVWYICVL